MIDQFNSRLDEIWGEHCSDDPDALVPLYHHSMPTGGILFVGLNPSFSASKIDRALRTQNVLLNDVRDHFLWTNREHFSLDHCRLLGEWAHFHHPYFKLFRKLADDLSQPWWHLDLYAFRETKQKNFLEYLTVRPDFGEAQLELFDDALAATAPTLIVVANATASDIVKRRHKPDFCNRSGHHFVDMAHGSVPIFFSSMWTGQRALDIHSRERLFWQIKQALN